MANTYTQLYFHVVFGVKGRNSEIQKEWKDELYKYISGIVANKNQKLMIINGMPDHVHLLIGTKPNCNLSNLIRDIKSSSTTWINNKKRTNQKFSWQLGFGAFTVSQSGLKHVINYIKNQEMHHKKKTFREEYIEFLNAYQIDYNEDYLFKEE